MGLLRGGSQKTNIEGGDYLKRGTLTVCWFKVGLDRKKAGWDPNAHYGNIYGNIQKNTVALLMGQLLFVKRFGMYAKSYIR